MFIGIIIGLHTCVFYVQEALLILFHHQTLIQFAMTHRTWNLDRILVDWKENVQQKIIYEIWNIFDDTWTMIEALLTHIV